MHVDLLPIEYITNDAPTAVTRLEITLTGMPHDGGGLAAALFNMRVRGRCGNRSYTPVEVYLTARVGAEVHIASGQLQIQHPDFTYTRALPKWLDDFDYECAASLHPLLDGPPSIGDVAPLDVFGVAVKP